MKIYFEGTGARTSISTRDKLLASQSTDECPGECSKKFGYFHNTATDFWQCQEDISWQSNRTFYQPSELYIHTYTHEHVLVCAPTSSGHIAVLDKDAVTLLMCFRSPTSLTDLAHRMPKWSLTRLEKMLKLFYALGFLVTHDEPVL